MIWDEFGFPIWEDERGFLDLPAWGRVSLIAGLGGAQAATSIYQTKRAGSINEKSIAAQSAADTKSLENDRYAVDAQTAQAALDREYRDPIGRASLTDLEFITPDARAFIHPSDAREDKLPGS